MTISNTLMVIHPFKDNGTWVFSDPAVGLVKEPFVFGMPEIIESALMDNGIPIPDAQRGFVMTFSAKEFPDAQVVLTWFKAELDGNWYLNEVTGKKGWLCPALSKYFPIAPGKIYVSCRMALDKTTGLLKTIK